MAKKRNDVQEFLQTATRPGPGCQTCAEHKKGGKVDYAIREWMAHRRAGESQPTVNALRTFLVKKRGYQLGVEALKAHILRCLDGGDVV